jgi:hypothetical protein
MVTYISRRRTKTRYPQQDRKNQLRSPISEEGGRKPNVLNMIEKIS